MTHHARSRGALVSRLLRTIALALVVLIAVGSAVAVLSGRYQARPVLSGSMRPGLSVGGIVVTKRVPVSSLEVRDVIVFHRPDVPSELVVHRIIALHRTGGETVIRTQGDANPVRDPWRVTLRGSTAYRAQFSLPLVGYAAIWWHQPATRTLVLTLAGLCALAALAVLLMSALSRRRTPMTEPPESDSPSTHRAGPSDVDAASDWRSEDPAMAETSR
ncbi:signal peptidase I [Nocardioides cynanchi]|uniref:signal peptidase I n=1 Tax=Nocardioides cynanchi TaxID=2558918 RepID=UPI0012461B99|nr:signal peptidase I [Nocardioides cynanchi]